MFKPGTLRTKEALRLMWAIARGRTIEQIAEQWKVAPSAIAYKKAQLREIFEVGSDAGLVVACMHLMSDEQRKALRQSYHAYIGCINLLTDSERRLLFALIEQEYLDLKYGDLAPELGMKRGTLETSVKRVADKIKVGGNSARTGLVLVAILSKVDAETGVLIRKGVMPRQSARAVDDKLLLKLVAHGCAKKEIADRLGIIPERVNPAIAELRKKFGVEDNLALAMVYLERLPPSERLAWRWKNQGLFSRVGTLFKREAELFTALAMQPAYRTMPAADLAKEFGVGWSHLGATLKAIAGKLGVAARGEALRIKVTVLAVLCYCVDESGNLKQPE